MVLFRTSLQLFDKTKMQTHVLYCIIKAINKNNTKRDERGRPKKYGGLLSPGDLELESPKTGDWKIGVRPVFTRLWGERVVYAIVTLPKARNSLIFNRHRNK